MARYNLVYTDTGKKNKTIIRGCKNTLTANTLCSLQLSVVDENGVAVNITGFTTSMKVYAGIEGALKLDAVVPVVVSAALGTVVYRISATDFATAAEADCGTHKLELWLADNAIPTKLIVATGGYITVIPSIID